MLVPRHLNPGKSRERGTPLSREYVETNVEAGGGGEYNR